ncbi:hypothetical protein KTD13_01775 [Burkholderia multivorans]|uniref:hypothetical protein n=1 Tax=Burkholderia multivorans TaxID=87883 RepID=UPI001C24CB1B|nr:hypothetical protein [Burkholderia multivorans]MBU9259075.1 hypothetical protein [Burkholderia multivorans]
MNKITLAALISAALLSGCASVSRTYGPDGREALTLNCSGLARNWGMCYKAAGDRCGSAGYDVLGRGGDGGYVSSGYGSGGGQFANGSGSFGGNFGGFGSSVITRTLIVQCRGRDS